MTKGIHIEIYTCRTCEGEWKEWRVYDEDKWVASFSKSEDAVRYYAEKKYGV